MNMGTIWFMNRERQKHERMADHYERRAEHLENSDAKRDRDAARVLRTHAEHERRLARRYETPGFKM